MTPISFRGPSKKDKKDERTYSQTTEGLEQDGARVATLLKTKGHSLFTIQPSTTIEDAITELDSRKIGVLLVLADDHLEGILSERDIVRGLTEQGPSLLHKPVSEIMTSNPVTCTPDDTLESIMRQMTDGRFRHMPVMDNGALSGLVSIRDVVHQRLTELEYENLKIKQLIVG